MKEHSILKRARRRRKTTSAICSVSREVRRSCRKCPATRFRVDLHREAPFPPRGFWVARPTGHLGVGVGVGLGVRSGMGRAQSPPISSHPPHGDHPAFARAPKYGRRARLGGGKRQPLRPPDGRPSRVSTETRLRLHLLTQPFFAGVESGRARESTTMILFRKMRAFSAVFLNLSR
jgi:hypothetical protein